MAAEAENLVVKLREIEEQANLAMQEIPHGLTYSRVQHILILARFVRMRLQGEPVAPVEALPEILRKGSNPPASG